MTRQRTFEVRLLGAFTLFIAVLTVVIAFAAPVQQAGRVQLAAKDFGAFVLPEANVQAASAASLQATRTAGALPAAGNPVFLPAVIYAIGGCCSSSVAVADVNGDGKPDLIAISGLGGRNGDGLVNVLLGNGDGTFRAANVFDSGAGFPMSVVVADLNNDGNPDLVVANCGTSIGGAYCPSGSRGVVSIFLGNGDGTFQGPATYDAGGFAAFQVAVADVNLDGRLDALVANECADAACTTAGGVTVLLGNGDGTLQSASAPWGQSGGSMAVADVNGDGRPDLLVLTGGSNNLEAEMEVLLGNGDGSFQPPVTYRVPGVLSARGMALADLNNDGKLDFVGVGDDTTSRGRVGVLISNGDGTFTPGATYSTGGTFVSSVAVADVNGDGNPDLLVGNCAPGTGNLCVSADGLVGVLIGTGHGTFRNVVNYDAGATGAGSVVAADLNGDGKPDLVVAHIFSNAVSVLLNQTAPFAFPTSTSLTSTLNPSVYGQNVTWTATVTPSGSIMPTGTVRFTWSAYTISSATLNASGVATLTRSNLNADPYPLKAVYVGDANNLGSTSPVLNQVITQTTTSAKLTSSPNPSVSGQAVTFTATITSPTVLPAGPVTFTIGTKVLGTGQLSGGRAKFTISTLAVGSTKVTATYYGDSNIARSSASVTQTVQQ